MIRKFLLWVLKIFGWKVIINLPDAKRYVVIAAPHTSNWDFPLGLCYIWGAGIPFRYMGKSALFKWPQKYLFKMLGGFPVDRDNKTKLTTKMANFINSQDKIALALAPEGTRSKLEYWRTGFYYIALEAKVPIAMAALNYGKRELGIMKTFMPSGDINADMKIIQNFYKDVKGKYPEKQSPIKIKPQ
ncbi:MAG TPA: 1-acyl-sn-glycerol-3-phosphate acyltransferase [Gammaproteobacteria bacterium]|nr:1-acyl-sn-glycerol-3-phosphate acyltransferase [Xanthomonadales bacterium]HOP21621.1 1-acyl-sn-glycerol-3-phosphate acyltransferase [Gammaproteobacteria bacterium]HPI95880.1 1-acyl-sn-glycerol-3-phosphate acyltransferase [Gammaproteobacteria bacterium]